MEIKSHWEFSTSELAGKFLAALLGSYNTLDELRAAHPSGISILAPGPHCDDSGKTVNDYRIIFSAAPLWKK